MHPDSGKSSGFLNKVMHMVRGKGSAARHADPHHSDSLSARDALQETVARKRRNDAIRHHEFAQLRQMRQRTEAGTQRAANQAHKEEGPSSIFGQETRSNETLQKIDAIEAQMSGQWWHQPASAAARSNSAAPPREKPQPRAWSRLPTLGEESMVDAVNGAAPASSCGLTQEAASGNASVAAVPAQVHRAPVFEPHPDLEEAAILFAHGDMDGARTRLLEQLVQLLGVEPVDTEKVAVLWHAVLDLCRATGDEESFEPLAIDYAEHFGRSAPLWSSIPARIGLPALYGAARQAPARQQFQWSCPAMLTAGAVTALRASQAQAPQPWSMSWLRLSSVDEAALAPLAKLLDEWAGSAQQFVMSDAGKLLQLLKQNTPVGDTTQSAQWWAVRMAVLRLMNRLEAYEQVALDYCITYEVSPPSWVDPVCQCVVQEEGEADVSILQEASVQSMLCPAAGGGQSGQMIAASLGLSGVIEGDAQPWLDAVLAQAQPGKVLEIPCENLIRLDFVAAGSVLNWAADMQNQGYILKFTQLHQLAAVFFHTIGIHEHATIQATQV